MTSKEIQSLICKREIHLLNPVCENVNHLLYHEMDVCSLNKTGYITEYEVKISKADFKKDATKNKWKYFAAKVEKTMPNYFYYVCPELMISVEQVPEFAGLIYVVEDKLVIIKQAPLIHRFKHDKEKVLTKFARVLSQRFYLGCCLITYLNKEHKKRMSNQNTNEAKITNSIF